MSSEPETSNKSQGVSWRNLLLWCLLAILIRWQVIEPRWIPSGSMLPTLQIQDRILVEKIRPRMNQKRQNSLSFGNIVVFHPPQNLVKAGYESKSALIKRVIGTPGDQIEVHEGKLFRNGYLVQETWRSEPMNYEMDVFTIPEGQLWVLGDNRNNSLDSHLWGPLPEKDVIGTAVWRYWPLNRFGPIRFPTQLGH